MNDPINPNAWKELFRDLAIELKCLPSAFIDANEHVFRKARELTAQQAVSISVSQESSAAIKTLSRLGFTWRGGELWAPPLGPIPERFSVQPKELIQVVGIKDGKETLLGHAPMPARMKARELACEQFGPFEDGDGSDAELCFCALEQLIEYTQTLAPMTSTCATPEQLRLASVIAQKIEDGTLFQAGIFSRRELANVVRALLP